MQKHSNLYQKARQNMQYPQNWIFNNRSNMSPIWLFSTRWSNAYNPFKYFQRFKLKGVLGFCRTLLCLIRIITQSKIILLWFLMGDFLRFNPWSRGLEIRVLMLFLREKKIVQLHLWFFFFQKIVKFLQLQGCR